MPEIKLPVLDGGLNIQDLEHKIENDQSPDMLNLWYRNRSLSKRWGQEQVALKSGGDPVTLTSVHGISREFEGYVCVHDGTKLYKWDMANDTVEEIATVGTACTFMEFNGNLYHIDGQEIREINADWQVSTVTPHVPVVYINCVPDLSSSDPNDNFNLIGAGFTVWYNGDGVTTAYKLPLQELDVTEVKATVGATDLTEGTHFTVNRTTGTVNFSAGTAPHGAPAEGINNVRITAYKTVDGNKGKITGCAVAIPFGGESGSIEGGTRAFMMKNADYPRTYWYSDLGAGQGHGMSYFPDTQFEELVQNNDAITAAGKQAGKLVILKERSLFTVDYVFDGEEVFYPVSEVNSTIGCDVPGSVQLIDNNLVFANTYGGVFVLINMSGSAEENVRLISGNVNGTPVNRGLLQEPGLKDATSIDHDRKYWLCVNGKVYLWDYDLTPYYPSAREAGKRLSWFKFDNVFAEHWHGGEKLYYGTGTKLVRFIDRHNDFGKPIKARWRSKSFDFGTPNYLKKITGVYPSIRADRNSAIKVSVASETKIAQYTRLFVITSFSWATATWSTLSWAVQRFSKPYKIKPHMRNVVHCQVWVEGEELNRDMGITDLTIDFVLKRRVK